MNIDTQIPQIDIGANSINSNIDTGGSYVENNYNNLKNKPSINNVVLQGNKTLEELGIQDKLYKVTLDDETGIVDKTPAEIYQATQDGKYPVLIGLFGTDYNIIPLNYVTEETAIGMLIYETSAVTLTINSDKTTTSDNHDLATLNDIPDVSDFITSSVNNLLNYYLKSETYTKTEVNNLIGSITTISFEVAQTKPLNPQSNIIYLIPKNPAEQDDIYNEWIYVNNNWELIGTTEIDLSNYYTKSEIDQIMAETSEDISTLLEQIVQQIIESIPTKTSELTNDNGFIDNSVDNLDNYYTKPINNSLGGIMMPDTTNMTPIKTIEYDLSSNAYFKFMSIANDFTSFDDIAGECLFRITTTGASVNVMECYFSLRQTTNFMPFMIVRNRPGAGVLLAANTGLRYIRYAYPKALNSGYDWDLEFEAINSNARHIKIEVFSSSSNITWYESLTPSTLNTTNQTSSTITLSTSDSLNLVGTFNMTASTATSAQYLTSYLPKFLSGTLPHAGQAISAQQFIFLSDDNKFYPSSNKTKPIKTGIGLQLSSNNVNLNSAVPNSGLRQKYNNATLTHIPHATLTTGDECWFRCTIDANGNIYSDNYVDTVRRPGYTWYHIGMATSATAINTDTTQSTFYTLDANGKLTHIDGLEIA